VFRVNLNSGSETIRRRPVPLSAHTPSTNDHVENVSMWDQDDSDNGSGASQLDSNPDGGTTTSLNDQVKNWAFNKKGQQVGDGECFALADQALTSNGAKTASDFGTVTADANYTWGTSVATLNDALPGDIIQFRKYQVVTTTTTTTTTTTKNSDGTTSIDTQTSTDTQTLGRPHHTAIIWSTSGAGVVNVLEQNVDPGGKTVQNNVLNFSDSSTSSSNVSQPDPSTTVKTDTTVTIKVTGTKWIYRPVKK
jgi:hypothetical protein